MKSTGTRPSQPAGGHGRKKPPGPSQMDALLQGCGINLAPSQLKQLWAYHQLLRRHDAELNLTRIRNFENMVLKLYADSILPALHAPLPSPLLDLGTGPGMPGIPLKIFRPDLHILLAESRQNRTEFLKKAVAGVGLPGLDVVDRGIAPDYDQPVAGVITRAVEPIADTLARVAGCLMQDGMVIFMKGPRCDEEIERASKTFASVYELADDIPYRIPHTPHRRRLVVFRRTVKPISAGGATQMMQKHRIRVIESESNAIFKDLKKLLGGRGVKKQGKTLVCGTRLVAEVIKQAPERCLAWISSGNRHAAAIGCSRWSGMGSTGTGTVSVAGHVRDQTSHRSFRLSRTRPLAAGSAPAFRMQPVGSVSRPGKCGCRHSLCRGIRRGSNHSARRKRQPLPSQGGPRLGRDRLFRQAVSRPFLVRDSTGPSGDRSRRIGPTAGPDPVSPILLPAYRHGRPRIASPLAGG